MPKSDSDRNFRQFVKPMVSVYKYCFVLLFSISFLCENAFAFATNRFISGKENSGSLSAVFHSKHKASDFSIDFLLLAEADGVEDSETESDNGHEVDFCFAGPGRSPIFEIASGKSSSLNFVSLIQNREPISLIVLHHSWKNDLA